MPDWERQSLRENRQCPDLKFVCLAVNIKFVSNAGSTRMTNEAHGRRQLKRLASNRGADRGADIDWETALKQTFVTHRVNPEKHVESIIKHELFLCDN